MLKNLFETVSEQTKSEAVKNLIDRSSPRPDFFLLIFLSVLMATFGMLIGSAAVVIGSMLIAPMLYPILGVGLGITMSDPPLLARSFQTLAKSIFYALVASFIVTILFYSGEQVPNSEILLRIQPSLIDMAIAIVAGLAASFAMVKPQLNESLPGVAISVALIPPLSVVGIGIAWAEWSIIRGSSLVFLINVFGVVGASTIIFSIMNFYTKRQVAENEIKKEEEKINEPKSDAKT